MDPLLSRSVTVVTIRPGALALALGAMLVLAGCGEEGRSTPAGRPPDPLAEVEQAGRSTFAQEILTIRIEASSPHGSFAGSGRIEPRRGRSRFVVEESEPELVGGSTILGVDGEGYETTFSESRSTLFEEGVNHHSGRPCWFNPHAPAGYSAETISVEEATRVLGSIMESLPRETRSAKPATGRAGHEPQDVYDVRLAGSASKPRNDFEETKRRVWGDRALLDKLAGPLRIEIGEAGTIDAIELELEDYRSGGYPSRRVKSVRIRAELDPGGSPLRLKAPNCLAME